MGRARQFNEATAWATLIESRVLDKVHRFSPLRFESIDVERGSAAHLPKSVHHSTAKTASMSFRDIVGYTQTPPWPTCSPQTYEVMFSDLHLAHHCVQNEAGWAKAPSEAWLTMLLNGGNMLVRRKAAGSEWCFALGHSGGTVGIAWPAVERRRADGKTCWFEPDCKAHQAAKQSAVHVEVAFSMMSSLLCIPFSDKRHCSR
jgi:hypothetical protein